MLVKPLPCPFCGADDIRFREGSTFRWIVAYCISCDAQAGEVRRNMLQLESESQAQAEADATVEWNKRAYRLSWQDYFRINDDETSVVRQVTVTVQQPVKEP